MATQIKLCTYCRRPADSLCQRCRDPYCSNKCQADDWPIHKQTCIPMPALVKQETDYSVTKPLTELVISKLENDLNGNLLKMRPPHTVNDGHTVTACRMPKTQADVESKKIVSLFDNPFKRNSQNVAFQSNDPLKLKENIASIQSEKSQITESEETTFTRTINYHPNKTDQSGIRKSVPRNVEKAEPIQRIQTDKPNIKVDSTIHYQSNKADENGIGKSVPSNVEKAEPTRSPASNIKSDIQINSKIPAEADQVIPDATAIPENPKQTKSKLLDIEPQTPVIKTKLHQPWMKPFPIEDKGFIPVMVHYATTGKTQTAWVILLKNETACNRHLCEINLNISAAPKPTTCEITVNELFRVPFEGIYYRGVVLELLPDSVLVRLIDYGNEIKVPIDKLKSAIPLMKNLNAFGFQIKFQTSRKVEIGETLNIKVKSIHKNVMNVIVEGEAPLIFMSDIEILPIPIGGKRQLYCLDFENIAKGYISCCVYDTKSIARIEAIGAKITEYCKRTNGSYSPQVNELCLALFEDEQWYRAVAIKIVDSDTYSIMFIDYGNITTVKTTNIRQMTEEFMHICLRNKCCLKGFPTKPSQELVIKMAKFFNDYPIFTTEGVQIENDEYIIDIPSEN